LRNVLIIQRRMTEYRVPMFDALRHRLIENGVILWVVFGPPTNAEATRDDAGDLPWGVRVKNYDLHIGKSQIVWQNIPSKLLAKQDLIIIPHENMLLLNYVLLFKKWFHGKTKLAFWGHGANFQSQEQNSIRERFKAWTARLVDWWFTYTSLSMDKVIANGFPAQRITCLNNAIDVSLLQHWRNVITDEVQCALLKELGLCGKHLAVFLGGLYQAKRLTFIFSTADELRRKLPEFELIIIGDGPQRAMVTKYAASRPWCRWVGARHGREKVLYASLGQIMLNPGGVGLGILDSFALGIPLLTTVGGKHGPEISYLESGRNGLIVADNLKEYTKMAECMLNDSSLREELAKNCIRDSARYSLNNMVNNFSVGIMNALSVDKTE